jgi:RNA polymerase sigma-70 factor (ECF subfamily)
VFAIARNKIADARRTRGRFPVLLDAAAESSLAAAVADVAEGERDRLAFLDDCLQRLEGRSREVCDLHYRGGLPPLRIGALLGVQPNTVSKTLQRVREQLRECIEAQFAARAGPWERRP